MANETRALEEDFRELNLMFLFLAREDVARDLPGAILRFGLGRRSAQRLRRLNPTALVRLSCFPEPIAKINDSPGFEQMMVAVEAGAEDEKSLLESRLVHMVSISRMANGAHAPEDDFRELNLLFLMLAREDVTRDLPGAMLRFGLGRRSAQRLWRFGPAALAQLAHIPEPIAKINDSPAFNQMMALVEGGVDDESSMLESRLAHLASHRPILTEM